MLFTFFLRSGKTLDLPPFSKLRNIIDCPVLCSTGSSLLSHILPPVSQIVPVATLPDKCCHIPLFFLIDATGKILDSPSGKFYIVFYPDKDSPPATNTSNAAAIIREYWNTVIPMPLCYDAGGYYLGTFDDDNTVLFETISGSALLRPECWISSVISNYNPSLRYGSKIGFSTEKIHIRSCKS